MADDNNSTSQEHESVEAGACGHLAAMILELQQMALRMGAADVSTHLQKAYLETQTLRRQQRQPVRWL